MIHSLTDIYSSHIRFPLSTLTAAFQRQDTSGQGYSPDPFLRGPEGSGVQTRPSLHRRDQTETGDETEGTPRCLREGDDGKVNCSGACVGAPPPELPVRTVLSMVCPPYECRLCMV